MIDERGLGAARTAKFCCQTASAFFVLLNTDTIVAVDYHKSLLRILSKQMNLLHVAKSFYILCNG